MEESERPEILVLVNALSAAQILVESMDELKSTNFYKTRFKQLTNQYSKELIKHTTKYVEAMWEEDDNTSIKIIEGIEEVSKLMSKLDPAIIAELGSLLKSGNELHKIKFNDKK